MRKEIKILSETCRGDINDRKGEEEKMEILQLKSDTEKILKENEILKGHVERNDSLTNALQKGLDSSVQVNRMLENQVQVLTEKLSKAESACLETSEKNSQLERELATSKNSAANGEGQNDIQVLMERLSETEKHKLELIDKNLKLERDIVDSMHNAAIIDANLQGRIQHLTDKLSEVERDLLQSRNCSATVEASQRSEIQNLTIRLSETETRNHDLFERNVKLERDIVDLERNAATADANLQSRIQNLTDKLSEAERDLLQSKNNSDTIAASHRSEIQDLARRLSEIETYNHELYNKNTKLERDLVDSIHNAVTAETNLQSQIHDLTQKLYGAENEKRELSEEIKKLEVESVKGIQLKEELCSLKDLFNTTMAELQTQIVICETSVIDAKKTESELKTKNETLEEELKGWRKKYNEFESVKAEGKPEPELAPKGEAEVSDTNTAENQVGSQVRFSNYLAKNS